MNKLLGHSVEVIKSLNIELSLPCSKSVLVLGEEKSLFKNFLNIFHHQKSTVSKLIRASVTS